MIDLSEYYGGFRGKTLSFKGKPHNIYYVLIFAEDRLVVAKLGESRGLTADEYEYAGLTFGAFIGGITGAILGSNADERARQKKKEVASRMVGLSPEEILKLEEENFEIAYSEIEKVEMKRGTLWIEGKGVTPALVKLGWSPTVGLFRKKPSKEMWFDIAPDQDYKECKTIVSKALQSKLVTN